MISVDSFTHLRASGGVVSIIVTVSQHLRWLAVTSEGLRKQKQGISHFCSTLKQHFSEPSLGSFVQLGLGERFPTRNMA